MKEALRRWPGINTKPARPLQLDEDMKVPCELYKSREVGCYPIPAQLQTESIFKMMSLRHYDLLTVRDLLLHLFTEKN